MENPNLNKALHNDRRLAQKFEHALNLTIEKYICYIKFSLFKEKYHQIHAKAEPCLKRIHRQLQMELKSQMKVNAVTLYAEQGVSYLLHSFEKIVDWFQESNLDETVEQTLSVSKVQKSVKKDCPLSKVEYRDKLKRYLQKLSSENDATENIMFQNHEEILDLKECIINLNQAVCKLLDDLNDSSSCKTGEILFEIKLDDSGDII
ncbi:hypothetical protein AVEN_66727-1 [Araneus ventricosus]|uniref:Uncharacterized protein n=1 Tax=Araneus ventricosus TaxID=182803 RepID=A0A4Y2JKY3_ARAVE|nr:hypothetical protein AVEN_66727-1 [Araneus ventricosus]